MSVITKRQFEEWPLAMLAMELSKDKKPNKTLSKYYGSRALMTDRVFLDKILLLVSVHAMEDHFWWLVFMDEYLPVWMFNEVLDLLICLVDINQIIYYTRSVDGLLFMLGKGADPHRICWEGIRSLNRLHELRPWVKEVVTKSQLGYDTSIEWMAIMGVAEDFFKIQYFNEVKNVLKFGNGKPGIWQAEVFTYVRFDGYKDRYLRKMLENGWIVVFHIKIQNLDPPLYKMVTSAINIIIEKKLSYFLFDKNTKFGAQNVKKYGLLSEDVLASMVELDRMANPRAYNHWLDVIKKL